MYSKTTEIASEVQEKAKEEMKEIAGETEEAIDWVVQTSCSACAGASW